MSHMNKLLQAAAGYGEVAEPPGPEPEGHGDADGGARPDQPKPEPGMDELLHAIVRGYSGEV